jgi:tetratricopeptide (TPR) repeat protein
MQLTRTNVDDVALDDLWSDLNYLGNSYTRTSPDSVLRQVSFLQRRALSLLQGRQRPKQTRELYLINAKSCAMMAWISGDLGSYARAEQLNSSAWLYTQSADDYLARRWVRSTQARVAFWAGNAVESAQLAAEGLKYQVGGLSDAPLILAEARGWASVHAERQVLDAIARWTNTEDADPGVAVEDRFFNISKDRRHYMAGTALLSVGQTAGALREFHTASQVYDKLGLEQRWEAMDPMIRIDTGRAHLQLGDLDAAAAQVEPLLAADVSRQPDMVRAMLHVLTDDLSDSRWTRATAARGLVDALLNAQNSIRH